MSEAPGAYDPLAVLRRATCARVGLGRAGQGLPTAPMLAFQLAHARACDAVRTPLDVAALRAAIGPPSAVVDSAAPDRTAYLKNPGLGRRLGAGARLPRGGDFDVAVVVADGLSGVAAQTYAAPVIAGLRERLSGWTIAPVVIARQARVAIGDPIGQALGARIVVVLIGERPGLSAADSLGAYITWGPRPGRRDNERNCVSNIHRPEGLSCAQAANKIAWLLEEARRLGFTGVDLKDRQAADGDAIAAQVGERLR
jgi:ethanolamine ammonia-lyase small subunit